MPLTATTQLSHVSASLGTGSRLLGTVEALLDAFVVRLECRADSTGRDERLSVTALGEIDVDFVQELDVACAALEPEARVHFAFVAEGFEVLAQRGQGLD